MSKASRPIFTCLAAVSISTPIAAQSGPIEPIEHEVGVSLTVPLGGNKTRTSAKPRFDLYASLLQRDRYVNPSTDLNAMELHARPRATISFTIEQDPNLLVNGYQLRPPYDGLRGANADGNGGLNGFEIAAIAVGGLVIGAGVLLFARCGGFTDEGLQQGCGSE